jgi:hypothetical protein
MDYRALLPASVMLIAVGCGSVKIARINADPSRYQHRSVRVSGAVTTSAGLLGTGGYQIQDDTGKIFVVSRSGVPSSGSHVEVTGKVIAGAEVLGRPMGVVIREEQHKLK